MAFISNMFGQSGPVTLKVLPSQDGQAWVDADRNGTIDDGDAYVTLVTHEQAGKVDFQQLQQAVGSGPRSDTEVAESLGGVNTDLVNGSMCFDMLSTLHQRQTFESKNGELQLTLTPDDETPLRPKPEAEGSSTLQLVKDQDGVLRWIFPEAPAPPPPPEGAVTEATLVERDGILHWLFPGEVPADGDRIVGNTDTPAEKLIENMKG